MTIRRGVHPWDRPPECAEPGCDSTAIKAKARCIRHESVPERKANGHTIDALERAHESVRTARTMPPPAAPSSPTALQVPAQGPTAGCRGCGVDHSPEAHTSPEAALVEARIRALRLDSADGREIARWIDVARVLRSREGRT